MKKIFSLIFTIAFTFICVFCINGTFEESLNANSYGRKGLPVLVIDAGHGGIDAGTVGVDGTLEKDINLSIALKLSDFSKTVGFKSSLVRNGDYLVYNSGDNKKRSDLYNRLDYIKSINNSVLISIHQNYFVNEKEWGTQIWYSPNDSKSPILAKDILNTINNNLQKNNKRSNKKSDNSYYLLYKASSPSVMVECGFMSNAEENKRLQNNSYQNEMAYSIMVGYAEYLSEV